MATTGSFATGGSHALAFQQETTFGTIPASLDMRLVRLTSNGITLNKDSFQSEELRGDQQISDLRHGVKQVNGDFGFELSYLHFDDLIEAVVGDDDGWDATFTDTDVDWSATAAGPTFSQVAGTDLTTVLAAGEYIRTSGFGTAGNNGVWKIVSVATNAITVEDPNSAMVDEIVGASVTVERLTGATLVAGLCQNSFTMEAQFNDITQYEVFTGVTMNTWTLNIVPNGIVTGSFGVVGKSTRDPAFDTSPLDATTVSVVAPAKSLSPMDSFSGTLLEGGAPIAVVTAIELTLTRNLDPAFVIGDDTTVRVIPGRNTITGTVSAFFEDETLIEKFIDETETSLEFDLQDPDGNSLTVELPRIKYSGADTSVTNESGIVVSLPFTALLDEVSGSNIILTR